MCSGACPWPEFLGFHEALELLEFAEFREGLQFRRAGEVWAGGRGCLTGRVGREGFEWGVRSGACPWPEFLGFHEALEWCGFTEFQEGLQFRRP